MIQWGEIYSLKIETIDKQHQMFYDIVEEAERLLQDINEETYQKIVEVIKKIQKFTQGHFQTEEKFMEEIQYPHLAEHKLEHVMYEAQITDIDLEGIKGNEETYLLNALDFIVQWEILHISNWDLKMAEYYHQHK